MESNTYIHRKKIERTVIWLAHFGYSSRHMIAKMLNVKPTNIYVFFKKLIELNYVNVYSFSPANHKIVMLTSEGYKFARTLIPAVKIIERKRLSFPNIVHSYAIQDYLISKFDSVDSYLSESDIYSFDFYRRPDLIMKMKTRMNIAVEIELNQKSIAQIEYNFMQHIKDIKNNRYDCVFYVLPSDAIKRAYLSVYQKDVISVYDHFGGKLKKIGEFDLKSIRDENYMIFETYSFASV
ncbi:hypothetical protein [Providencia rettgeri]|uniref:hypothetical protein n=1 Tax=Providencia rettgeri TaxID=587 RepID=UPI00141954FE|nr:hypothetical protein [Providencia rettgeri]NIH07048.1 hypothetical protein [Providencia rettgeri]